MEKIIAKVESVLTKMGLNPVEARTENEGQWNIAKDESLELMLDVWEESDHYFFQVMSFVCPVGDPTRPEFFKLLLEENHGFCETAFTILEDSVYLKFTAEADDMSEERIHKSITRIAYYNEMFREKLK